MFWGLMEISTNNAHMRIGKLFSELIYFSVTKLLQISLGKLLIISNDCLSHSTLLSFGFVILFVFFSIRTKMITFKAGITGWNTVCISVIIVGFLLGLLKVLNELRLKKKKKKSSSVPVSPQVRNQVTFFSGQSLLT